MWLREMIETGAHRSPLSSEEKRALLSRLVQVFEFERFVQKAYLGQKVFSIEGLDAVVPMIDELVTLGRRGGAEEVVIGMAHRGRLSVLAHNLGRSEESILAEFEGAKALEQVKAIAAIPHAGTGDVKYHYGAEGLFTTRDGDQTKVRLYPNPSHLEFVDPVVTGAARLAQTSQTGPRLEHNPALAVPLLLHGDAAFPGQGVVAETLNLQSLAGYSTGGTVHIITDNQVGFTTDPEDARSTPYASDLAKGFNVPIVHVNADDVEACIAAIRLSMAYRERWSRDVVIDLIGYRRYGHNETDEPAYTQPTMAAQIKSHQPVSEIYAGQLVKEGTVTPEEVETEGKERRDELQRLHKELKQKMEAGEYEDPTSTQIGTGELDRTKSPEVETAVSEDRLRSLNEELLQVPESFTIHRKLRKPLMRRVELLDEGPIEYGHAEALAFASLLTEGTHIRLTGQDTERGTFSHRHLALYDEKTGLEYVPIQNLSGALAPFELHNSPLSEAGCLGFEYGYSAASPPSLVLWEAQFGDFGNAAQVIIDSFIASGEAKWGQTTRLTLLLPHGYEGSGPEHSSARIERFIALAAEGNMRLANPTTAAQYFHLLRRQARIRKARPLVVFTPKGLLRHQGAASRLADLTSGAFQFVLDDPRAADRKDQIERLVLCSGKVYYDMDGHERREDAVSVAIARVELLYPFAKDQIRRADRQLSEPEGDRLGAGGAAEHGRLEGDDPAHAGAGAGAGGVPLRGPAPARQPQRGLPRRPPLRAGADRADGADIIQPKSQLRRAGARAARWMTATVSARRTRDRREAVPRSETRDPRSIGSGARTRPAAAPRARQDSNGNCRVDVVVVALMRPVSRSPSPSPMDRGPILAGPACTRGRCSPGSAQLTSPGEPLRRRAGDRRPGRPG